MAKYKLKKGVFIRQIGLQPLCEWFLTDELAESYLKNDPTLIRYFDIIPAKVETIPEKPKVEKVIEPEETEKKESHDIPESKNLEPETIIIKPKRKRTKTKK